MRAEPYAAPLRRLAPPPVEMRQREIAGQGDVGRYTRWHADESQQESDQIERWANVIALREGIHPMLMHTAPDQAPVVRGVAPYGVVQESDQQIDAAEDRGGDVLTRGIRAGRVLRRAGKVLRGAGKVLC